MESGREQQDCPILDIFFVSVEEEAEKIRKSGNFTILDTAIDMGVDGDHYLAFSKTHAR